MMMTHREPDLKIRSTFLRVSGKQQRGVQWLFKTSEHRFTNPTPQAQGLHGNEDTGRNLVFWYFLPSLVILGGDVAKIIL